MSVERAHTWQDIQAKIRANIKDRTWPPGELIPGEETLAEQYGCARTTVNRALRELASTGVIDRKRKAGTRVALQNTRRVTANIPVIRAQIQELGRAYRFEILLNEHLKPPKKIQQRMRIRAGAKALHLKSVHFADSRPYIYEDRWINIQTIKEIKNIDLNTISANEWLVQHIPFTSGDFVVEAEIASKVIAKLLELKSNDPVLVSRRATWLDDKSVTEAKLYYAPGYQMKFDI